MDIKRIGVAALWCLAGIGMLGCTSSSSSTKTDPPKKVQKAPDGGGLLPKSAKKILKKRYNKGLPPGVLTIKVKKKIPLYLFLHPKGILSNKPYMAKGWSNTSVLRGRSASWYVKLKPEAGARIGRYVIIRAVMAVWNAAGNFGVTSRVSLQFLLRRGNKDTLLFSTMQLPKGQNYKAYTVTNREINYDNDQESLLKDGDVLIFRVKHRSGNGGAVALGGGLGARGNFFVIAQHQIGNYYRYTK